MASNNITHKGNGKAALHAALQSLSFVIVSASTAAAQCAMCKANIAGAENAAEVSSAVNSGVLVLLIPTLAIISGVVRLILKYRH